MRRLSIFAILLIVILGGLWLAAETLLARELRKLSEQDPNIEIGTVSELRELQRIGVHLGDLEAQTLAGILTLPTTELWLSPVHLTEGRLALPAEAVLDTAAGPRVLGLGSPEARLKLRPLSGLTLGSFALDTGGMTVEGTELVKAVQISAELARLGNGAPLGAVAAYDFQIAIADFDPALIAPEIRLPGALNITAKGRLWLDGAPGPQTLTPDTRPALVGFQIEEAELRLGNVSTMINGRVQADALGRPEGELAISTRDIKPLLEAATSAGLIPEKAVVLAEAVWQKLATRREGNTDGGAAAAGADQAADDGAGPELRLPLGFSNGKIHLGPLPLGPAPLFPR